MHRETVLYKNIEKNSVKVYIMSLIRKRIFWSIAKSQPSICTLSTEISHLPVNMNRDSVCILFI